MTGLWRGIVLAGLILCGGGLQTNAQDTPLPSEIVRTKRFVFSADVDLPGGDLSSIFDTTLNACVNACRAQQSCTNITFNARNGSCFLKQNPGEPAAYAGAISARLVATDARILEQATAYQKDLDFLNPGDFTAAQRLSEQLTGLEFNSPDDVETLLEKADDALKAGNADIAQRFYQQAIHISDLGSVWSKLTGIFLVNAPDRAFESAINAYIRHESTYEGRMALHQMAAAAEKMNRGADAVKIYRLAEKVAPSDIGAELLAEAAQKYGFRLLENDVQFDNARPRICMNMSEPLIEAGFDYTPFVQSDETGLAVQVNGKQQLCVEGVSHGSHHQFTLREGLPAADGQTLLKSVVVNAYVRDRSPGVRFQTRNYILPKTDQAALPVETVNADRLDLTLYQVSDRSLIRSVQNFYFASEIDEYNENWFKGDIGQEVWSGTADVGKELNKTITTRLPLAEPLKGLEAGIYVLNAKVKGQSNDPGAWQWFVVSDLGLTGLSGTDGVHVFVRSLKDATPKKGIEVELISRSNSILAKGMTDDQGHVRLDVGLVQGKAGSEPEMIVARQGDSNLGDSDLAMLSLTDPEFDLSDRGVEGRAPAGPIDVFLTTDRGAYRAGETVYATALSRDSSLNVIEGLPLTAVIKRPDGVEYDRHVAPDVGKGGHVYAVPITANAPRGVWKMEIYADTKDRPLTAKTFLVEDFLPERIDYTLTAGDARPKLGQELSVEVAAKYLFGPAGADLPIEGEVTLRAASGLAKFPGYQFGRADDHFSPQMEPFIQARTDEQGHATAVTFLPEVKDVARPLEAEAVLRISEGSGRPVERKLVQPVAVSGPMIGIKPLFEGEVPENGKAAFAVIGIGDNDRPQPMKATWELVRLETNYQWYRSGGGWFWEPMTTRTRIAQGKLDLGTVPMDIAENVTWGEYELVVQGPTPAAVSSVKFYAGWYVPADVQTTPDMLEMSLDKPAYQAGDTAQLRMVPRMAGKALVMVMSDHLVAMQAVDVSEGENLVSLPVTAEWGAGAYVTATVLRPMDAAQGHNPARALGLAYAGVNPQEAQLKVTFDMPAEAQPRQPMEVALKVDNIAAGDQAYVTIAAVDVGILNLTGFKAPDPSSYYFGQRKLGMGIRDVYGRLIDGLHGAQGQVRSGGDGGAQARLQAPPPTEQLVAYFTGPVEVGADGMARTTFNLPPFNGTVKLMAVAWSGKGVGQAQHDVLVRDPVVVSATLPRFMAPGDHSRLRLEFIHTGGSAGEMGLKVTAQGVNVQNVPADVTLTEGGKYTLDLPLAAKQAGLFDVNVQLTTPDGKVLDKVLRLPVQSNDPEIARVTRFDLAAGDHFMIDQNAFAGIVPGTGRATLAIGAAASLNIPGLLADLDSYPYGCTEQMTSRALPMVYYDRVAQAMQLKGAENIGLRIEESVSEILQNQGSDGSFGLWSAGGDDGWLDAYVTDFLSRARARGHKVPDTAFRNALDNLRNRVNRAADFDGGGEDLAYALLVLAREGAAAVGDLRYYADIKGDSFATPLAQAQLGAALAAYGDQPRADMMLAKAQARLNDAADKAQIYRIDYGTDLRDRAAVAALASEAGSKAVNVEELVASLMQDGPRSTQENVWSLMAAQSVMDNGPLAVSINGAPFDGPPVRMVRDMDPPMAVQNNGPQTRVTFTTFGVPETAEPAGGNGYAITRRYYSMTGEEMAVDQVPLGTRLVTVLEVTPFAAGTGRVMVVDPLPAGFEIDNPHILSGGDVAALNWPDTPENIAHSEFRQDRFMAALDRQDNKPFRLAYIVRAVSPGQFHHPAASVEDMYRPDFRARSETGMVVIGE